MKTLVIYNNPELELTWFTLDGDYRHLHNHYLNIESESEDEVEQERYKQRLDELNNILFPDDAPRLMSLFTGEALPQHDACITVGFVP